jgi:predicted small lipoprotein YifL
MKKIISITLVSLLLLIGLTGCGKQQLELPDKPVVFETTDNGDYISIKWNEKEYVPYCSFSPSQLGECLGYYLADDGEKVYVCELKEQSSDEWLVDTIALKNCNEGMIFKEKNTTNIPDGLESDYEWNQ